MAKEPEISDKENKLFSMIWELIAKILALFGGGKSESPKEDLIDIPEVPKLGDDGLAVKILQEALNRKGSMIKVDGEFGTVTLEALRSFQKKMRLAGTGRIPSDGGKTFEYLGLRLVKGEKETTPPTSGAHEINPAYIEAKKYSGKKETDPAFNKWLSGFWPKVGLPNYKTIIGSSFAWCALFFFAMNSQVGQNVTASAGAKRLGSTSGFTIDWKKNGIPEGAGVWKNSSNCSSASGNHVTWAAGDCTPEHIMKKGATWPGYGGNQGNAAKTSIYCAKGDCAGSKDVICRVFWHKKNLPGRITKSVDCGSGSSSGESTR